MSRYPGLQYCKTDLIATKGIVFVKYSKSSAACLVMETVQQTGMVRPRGCRRFETRLDAVIKAGLGDIGQLAGWSLASHPQSRRVLEAYLLSSCA